MMTGVDFEKVLFGTLMQNDELVELVDGKIYALRIPNGTYLPCVTFQRLSGMPAHTLQGHSGLEEINLQVDAWGRSYEEAKNVAKAVRSAMPETGSVFGAHLITDADFYEDGVNYYRISMEFTCWYLEQE